MIGGTVAIRQRSIVPGFGLSVGVMLTYLGLIVIIPLCVLLLKASDAQVLETLSGMRDFAQCMRSHGVPDWPDPTTDTSGQPVFDLRGRIAPDSPRMDATSSICDYYLHPAPGQNGTVLCNGIGEAGCHHYG